MVCVKNILIRIKISGEKIKIKMKENGSKIKKKGNKRKELKIIVRASIHLAKRLIMLNNMPKR